MNREDNTSSFSASTPNRPGRLSATGWLGWFIVGILAATTVGGFLGSLWWVFDLASHFRWQYLLASAAVLVVALLLRQMAVAAALTLLLIVNLCLILPFYYPRSQASERQAELRLMMLNVQSSNREFARARDVIHDESPDVLFVLEFNDQWSQGLEEIEAEYRFAARVPRPHNFGIAVYSRLPLRNTLTIEIGEQRLPALLTSVEAKGRLLTLFGAHVLPPVSRRAAEQRNLQLRDIAGRIRSLNGPVALLGDLNCTSWSPHLRRVATDAGLVDSRQGAGFSPPGRCSCRC